MNDPIHVLLIKDEPLTLKMLETKLQKEGFQVTCCMSVKDALLQIHERQYDVILTGALFCNVPRMDLIHDIKEKYPEVPLLILGDMKHEKRIWEALDLGADDFINNHNELMLRLKWVIKKQK